MKKFISLLIINKVYDRLPEISILKSLFTSSFRCRGIPLASATAVVYCCSM
jgi:hypothetical protein